MEEDKFLHPGKSAWTERELQGLEGQYSNHFAEGEMESNPQCRMVPLHCNPHSLVWVQLHVKGAAFRGQIQGEDWGSLYGDRLYYGNCIMAVLWQLKVNQKKPKPTREAVAAAAKSHVKRGGM